MVNHCVSHDCENQGTVTIDGKNYCTAHAIALGFCPKCGVSLHLEGILARTGFSSEYCLCFECGREVVREWEEVNGTKLMTNYYGL